MSTEDRIKSLEELMATHKHGGYTSVLLDNELSDGDGDLRVGKDGKFFNLSVGSDGQLLTPDSSVKGGLKWSDVVDTQDLYYKAERGIDNLYIAKLNGLYSGIGTDENRYSEKFDIYYTGAAYSIMVN